MRASRRAGSTPYGCRLAGLAVAALLVATGAGCGKDHAENKGTDNAYIHAPGEKPEPVPMGKGDLLPGKNTDHWMWDVAMFKRTMTNNEVKQELVSRETEEMVVSGTKDLEHTTATVYETRKGGKPYREEMYATSKDDLVQVAAGLNDKVIMSPPLPLIHLPVTEGQGQSWTGVLKYQKSATPGTGYSRVSATEKVKTPAGEFGAYRVDTIIITTLEGKQVSFPMTRWFAPGVGMVRQRMYIGNLLVEKLLHTYEVEGAPPPLNPPKIAKE